MTKTKRVLSKSRIRSLSDEFCSHSKTSGSNSPLFERNRTIEYCSFCLVFYYQECSSVSPFTRIRTSFSEVCLQIYLIRFRIKYLLNYSFPIWLICYSKKSQWDNRKFVIAKSNSNVLVEVPSQFLSELLREHRVKLINISALQYVKPLIYWYFSVFGYWINWICGTMFVMIF